MAKTAATASLLDQHLVPVCKNVRDTYFAVPGDSVEIDVQSPVTGKTYTMNCVRTGDRVTCRGGNEAVVTFGV